MNNVNELPVGIYSKTSGATTISANALKTSGISKIILKDNTTGINTDLLTSDYKLHVTIWYRNQSFRFNNSKNFNRK